MIVQESIDAIETKAHSLILELKNVLLTTNDIRERERQMEVERVKLNERDKAIFTKQQENEARSKDLDADRIVLAEENEKLSRRTVIVAKREETLEEKVKDYNDKINELNTREAAIHTKEGKLIEREAEILKAEEKIIAVTEREAEVQKQVAIDRERKRLLDVREDKIKQDEIRIAPYLPQDN